MLNPSKILLAVALAAGAVSAAQAGEGSIDSQNNVIGTEQYQRGYGGPYSYGGSYIAVPGPGYVGPGYYGSSTAPMIEEDTTGYAPRSLPNDDYDDESGNQ